VFFVFENSNESGAFGGKVNVVDYEGMLYSWLGRMIPSRPLVVYNAVGHRLMDTIWMPPIPIFHLRVVEILLANNVTGFDTVPVTVVDHNSVNREYSMIRLLGRCRRLSLDADGALGTAYETRKNRMIPYYQGLKMEVGSWDGSDLFCGADGATAYGAATDRVRMLFEEHKVSNVTFTPFDAVKLMRVDLPILPSSKRV
jgi:hypothetical protein